LFFPGCRFVFTQDLLNRADPFSRSEPPIYRFQLNSSEPVIKRTLNAGADFVSD